MIEWLPENECVVTEISPSFKKIYRHRSLNAPFEISIPQLVTIVTFYIYIGTDINKTIYKTRRTNLIYNYDITSISEVIPRSWFTTTFLFLVQLSIKTYHSVLIIGEIENKWNKNKLTNNIQQNQYISTPDCLLSYIFHSSVFFIL